MSAPSLRTSACSMIALCALLFGLVLGPAGPGLAGPASPDSAAASDGEQTAAGSPVAEAQAAYVSSLTHALGRAWSAGEVFTEPATAALWDERQREIIADQVELANEQGLTPYIAVLPPLAVHDRDGEYMELDQQEDLLERVLLADIEAREVDSAVYALWTRSWTYVLVIEGGVLRRELSRVTGYLVNDEVPGPGLHHAMRTVLDPASGSELLDAESDPQLWFQSAPRPAKYMDSGPSAVSGFTIRGALIVGGVLLALYIAAFPLCRAVRSRSRRRRDEKASEARTRRAILAQLQARASSAHERLLAREPVSQQLGEAVSRLPAPDDTHNPLVWTAWTVLLDESRGTDEQRCFFRPDQPAASMRSWSGLGTDFEVPVSKPVDDALQDGRLPSYLSARGIDRGRPYWKDRGSPFAATGFGAFGPLSAAIEAMPTDWTPDHGSAQLDELPAPRRRAREEHGGVARADSSSGGQATGRADGLLRATSRKQRADGPNRAARRSQKVPRRSAVRPADPHHLWARPRWADALVALLLAPLLALACALPMAWHNQQQLVKIASAGYLPPESLLGDVDTERLDDIEAEITESGLYVDRAVLPQLAPSDQEEIRELLEATDVRTVVVVLSLERTDEFRGSHDLLVYELQQRLPAETVLVLARGHGVDIESHDLQGSGSELRYRDSPWDSPLHVQIASALHSVAEEEWWPGEPSENWGFEMLQERAAAYERPPVPGGAEHSSAVRSSLLAGAALSWLLLAVGALLLLRFPFSAVHGITPGVRKVKSS